MSTAIFDVVFKATTPTVICERKLLLSCFILILFYDCDKEVWPPGAVENAT